MKQLVILLQTLYLAVVVCMFGGGYLSKYGYILLAVYFFANLFLFPNISWKHFFCKESIPLWIFIVFIFLSSELDINYTIVLFAILLSPLLFNFQIALFHKYHLSKKMSVFMTLSILLMILVFCFRTIAFLNANPLGLRLLISREKNDAIIIGGAFGLPYSLSIFTSYLVFLFSIARNKWLRIVCFLLLLFCSYVVIRSTFTTAVLILLIGIIWGYIANKKTTTKLIVIILGLFIIVPFVSFLPQIISEINPSAGVMLDRLDEVNSIVQGESLSTASDLSSRLTLAFHSLSTFLSHPLLGVGWQCHYDYYLMFLKGVGGHSEWLDMFARYGLFATLIILYLRNIPVKYASYYKATLLPFILMGFTNPIFFFQIFFVMFYLIPMIDFMLFENNILR